MASTSFKQRPSSALYPLSALKLLFKLSLKPSGCIRTKTREKTAVVGMHAVRLVSHCHRSTSQKPHVWLFFGKRFSSNSKTSQKLHLVSLSLSSSFNAQATQVLAIIGSSNETQMHQFFVWFQFCMKQIGQMRHPIPTSKSITESSASSDDESVFVLANLHRICGPRASRHS